MTKHKTAKNKQKLKKVKVGGWLLAILILFYFYLIAYFLFFDYLFLPGGEELYATAREYDARYLSLVGGIVDMIILASCITLIHVRRKILAKFYLVAMIVSWSAGIALSLYTQTIARDVFPYFAIGLALDAAIISYLFRSTRVKETLTR